MLTVQNVIDRCVTLIENPATGDTLREACLKELLFYSPRYFELQAERIAAATFADGMARLNLGRNPRA